MSYHHPSHEMIRHILSPFRQWLDDPSVEDIMMQRPNEVFIQRGGRTECHEVDFDFTNQQGLTYLAASLKRQNVGSGLPLLSADLPGGLRLQSVLPPCVHDGTVAFALRRSKDFAPSLDELGAGGLFDSTEPLRDGLSREDEALVALYWGASGTQDPESRRNAWMAFLKAAVKARKTCLLCGQVGSGKTYSSMALAREIPLEDRLVTIQDADEWGALPHRNKVDLFYSKGDQGGARITANDLVEASLRLAMRWLLLQEMRGSEAFSFLRARRSGHPGLSTCHAANTREVFPTLALMVRQHPAAAGVDVPLIEGTLRKMIDVVIHQHRPDGRFEVSEVWFGPAERAMGMQS